VIPPTSRIIRKGQSRSIAELRDLLQGVLVAEFIAPSNELWLVSPWVSDIPVIDNTDGGFTALEPTWGPRGIRLAEVLGHLARRGTAVYVETRPLVHNRMFADRLQRSAVGGLAPRVRESEVLHEKGLVGDGYYVSGSMNFTFQGLEILEEVIRYDTDPAVVSAARLSLKDRWEA
jgi:hypothetical protein